jgi:hypothetical protein
LIGKYEHTFRLKACVRENKLKGKLTSLPRPIISTGMKRAKQLGFEILEGNSLKFFGGAYLKSGNPKSKRPISIKRSSHLVMRSLLAKGSLSFLRHDEEIRSTINTQAKKFGVKVYRLANGGNHLHMVILPRSRAAFNSFIRSISGLIARKVLKAERGDPKNLKFWEKRPFTRIVEWGRDYKKVCSYLLQNTLEALGFVEYQPRKTRYVENQPRKTRHITGMSSA